MASGRNVGQQQQDQADYDVASAVGAGQGRGRNPYESAQNEQQHSAGSEQPMYDNARGADHRTGQATYDNAAHGAAGTVFLHERVQTGFSRLAVLLSAVFISL